MANVVFSATLLTALRGSLRDLPVKGQFYSNSAWRDGTELTAAIQQNGSVHFSFMMEKAANTATAFRLVNASGSVLISRSETITWPEGVDVLMYRFKVALG